MRGAEAPRGRGAEDPSDPPRDEKPVAAAAPASTAAQLVPVVCDPWHAHDRDPECRVRWHGSTT